MRREAGLQHENVRRHHHGVVRTADLRRVVEEVQGQGGLTVLRLAAQDGLPERRRVSVWLGRARGFDAARRLEGRTEAVSFGPERREDNKRSQMEETEEAERRSSSSEDQPEHFRNGGEEERWTGSSENEPRSGSIFTFGF